MDKSPRKLNYRIDCNELGVENMFYVNSRAIIERQCKGGTEIIIQTRNKPNEPQCIELPGGRIEAFESFLEALKREVKEETGLDIIKIEGEDIAINTKNIDPDFQVECIQPFAVYQTVKGPVDSVGVYFRCEVEGELLDLGDETKDIRWVNIEQLNSMMNLNPLQFSNIDRAGILFYLKNNLE